MEFTRENSLEFIEKWYEDIEIGYLAVGKTYKRPDDYIERALRVMNNSKKRNRMSHQTEGKTGIHSQGEYS